ncbi:MAG: MarR family transcriptional regulator [Myxococcota bacterium]
MDAVRVIVQALRVSSHAVQAASELTGAQRFVLNTLAERPALSVTDLAARTRTHQSSVSVVVARLAARGLVMRTPAEEDGRRVEVRITEEGRALLRLSPVAVQERLIEALDHLRPADRRALARGLAAWLRMAGLEGEPATFFFEDGEDA